MEGRPNDWAIASASLAGITNLARSIRMIVRFAFFFLFSFWIFFSFVFVMLIFLVSSGGVFF